MSVTLSKNQNFLHWSLFPACEWLVCDASMHGRRFPICLQFSAQFAGSCILWNNQPPHPPLVTLMDSLTCFYQKIWFGSKHWLVNKAIYLSFWKYLHQSDNFTTLSDFDCLYHGKTVLCSPIVSAILRGWGHCGNVAQLFFLWIIRHGLHFMRPTSDSCAPNNTAIENQGWIREEWIRFLAFDKKTDNAIDERRGALSIRGQNKRSSLKITLFFFHNLNLT